MVIVARGNDFPWMEASIVAVILSGSMLVIGFGGGWIANRGGTTTTVSALNAVGRPAGAASL
jgi:hypothetical protein